LPLFCGPRSLRSSCAYQKINVCWDLAQRFRIMSSSLALQPLHYPHTSPIGSRKTLSFIIHVKRPIIGAKSKEEMMTARAAVVPRPDYMCSLSIIMCCAESVRAVGAALRDPENSNDARRQGLYPIKVPARQIVGYLFAPSFFYDLV
jgi:hypothetical protein